MRSILNESIFLLRLHPWQDVETMVAAMSSDPRLTFVEPNYIARMPEADPYEMGAWGGYDDTAYRIQYAIDALNLTLAHEINQGAGVTIAVLDTGVQLDHPALAASLSADGYDYVDMDDLPADEGNGIDDDGDSLIDEAVGHGTHVAGIVHLVAPESTILPLRVLDSDGRGNTFNVAEAMTYAVDHGAAVLNLSMGMAQPSPTIRSAINYAVDNGIVVVAAAGNLNSSEPQYPAANVGVIGVAALDADQLKADFSNYGDWVALAAPGVSIYSTFIGSGYGWWSGTSMSAPFVAGQAALIHSLAPELTLDQIATQITSTAQSVDAVNPAYAGLLGAGQPDVAASLGCHWADVEPDATHDILNNSCDDDIDVLDVARVASMWRTVGGDLGALDTDGDGDVDIVDVQRVAGRWGWSRSPL